MIVRHTASVYVINNKKLLLMYNNKLKKWLQPGGHLEGFEMHHMAAFRECKQETGIEVKYLNCDDSETPVPVAIVHYSNCVGEMKDYQYCAIPINTNLKNEEGNLTGWFTYDEMVEMGVGKDILIQFKKLLLEFEFVHKYKLTKAQWNYYKRTE